MNPIYAICDMETLSKKGLSLLDFLQIIKQYNIKYIQYRDKISTPDTQRDNLLLLKSNTNIPIIINDFIELLSFSFSCYLYS
jgi:thiamine-phosphate pyrophosphorylase